jgi:S1-C subfamily serine protease
MKRLLAIWLFCLAAWVASGADLTELVRRAKPAILQLYPLDSRGEALGQATGFFWSNDGYALTNYHVIEDAASVVARSLSGARYKSEGRILRLGDLDVVLLHFKAKNTPYIATAPASAEITEGEHIVVIGNPDGLAATVSDGIVSAVRADGKLLQITAPVSAGSSGSPVLNDKGQLIGVVMGTKEGEHNQNLNFAISLSAIRSAARKPVEPAPERLPTRRPQTPLPGSSGHEENVDAKLEKCVELYWVIIDKIRDRGHSQLANEFFNGLKDFLDTEERLEEHDQLVLRKALISHELHWLQHMYDRLGELGPEGP